MISKMILHHFIVLILIGVSFGLPALSHRGSHGQAIPPKVNDVTNNVKHQEKDRNEISKKIDTWSSEDSVNVWELSGLFEGDIMLKSDDAMAKNGLIDEDMRWPNGIVPVFIEENDFDQEDIQKIKEAINEYHEKTCLKFRSYKESDEDYIKFQSSEAGCWSSVGRQGKAQVINLQNPGCLRHGTIVHEILHAVGFYHQQSAPNRDDYVKINWENIEDGKEHNFKKYDSVIVTDYNVTYDYASVMHYSSKAFSKNGEPTIIPLDDEATIGQRKSMSEKDLAKLQAMYRVECSKRKKSQSSSGGIISIIDFLTPPLD